MKYIQFVLYTPYLTINNKRDILKRKLKKAKRLKIYWLYEDLLNALIVSYGNQNEQRFKYPKWSD